MSTKVHVVGAGDGRRLTVPDADFLLVSAGSANSDFFGDLDALGHDRHPPDDVARLLHGITDRYGVELATGTGAS